MKDLITLTIVAEKALYYKIIERQSNQLKCTKYFTNLPRYIYIIFHEINSSHTTK